MSQRDANPGAGESAGTSGQHRDRETIAGYLDGGSAAVKTLDDWVRTEIRNSFPVLRDEADDLTQAVHAKLVKVLRTDAFRYRSSLKTYVVRLARYTCVDRVRAWHRAQIFRPDNESTSSSDALLRTKRSSPYRRLFSAERRTLLLQIVMLAPEMCRDLWRLAYIEQLSYQEIGARLSLPSGTIKSRMWSCRQNALRLLDKLGPSDSESDRGSRR